MKMVFEIETKNPDTDWDVELLGRLLTSEEAWLCPLTIKKLNKEEVEG